YRSDRDDDRHDHEPDHEPGPALGRPRVDDAEDREEQDRGPERLDEHRRTPGGDGMVEVHDPEAVAEVDRARTERRPHGEGASNTTYELRAPVQRDLAPREALRHGQRERHGRVDVAAGDLADRVDERD